jgi:LPPG:FO 2-phospho-L-lactate transferase
MRITALAGGIGGARFLRGLLHHLATRTGGPAFGATGGPAAGTRAGTGAGAGAGAGAGTAGEVDPDAGPGAAPRITVIGNTADDLTLHGLRVCPDLDTVMYTLGGGIHEGQGWGRADETFSVSQELQAYGSGPDWFTLGDRDLATHVVRTRLLGQGRTLSEVTVTLCARWNPGVRLLPMSDDRVETHVVLPDPDHPAGDGSPGERAVHFQEWWVRLHAAVPARRILAVGIEQAKPAPGVLAAIAEADVVLLPPSNPVVSIGTILGVPGIRDALRATPAPVVGVSPIVGGAPVRGMADACLSAIGVETSAAAVAGLYADFLDGWLVDQADAAVAESGKVKAAVRVRPLLMTDVVAASAIAGAALDLAAEISAR